MALAPPKPMLAVDVSPKLSKVRYPVYVQPKLDGIRAIVKDHVLWSRSGKPIPNKALQSWVKTTRFLPHVCLDGELIVGNPTDPDAWNKTSSVVMSQDKTIEDVTFHVFDVWHPSTSSLTTKQRLIDQISVWNLGKYKEPKIVKVPTTLIKTEQELLAAEDHYTGLGYEGLILRDPDQVYKPGRSTVNEGALLKLKRFEDAEGMVVGYGERMHNGNPAEKDAFGRTKRSSSKAGKTGRGDLGFLLVCDIKTGKNFELGVGFDDGERALLWSLGDTLLGKLVTFKFQKRSPTGTPIFPVFKGFRSKLDL